MMHPLLDLFTDDPGTEYKNENFYTISGNHANELLNLIHKLHTQLEWYKNEMRIREEK